MFIVDIHGMLVDSRIISARRAAIEHGDMMLVSGIVVYRSGAGAAEFTLESYKKADVSGAHFLIDKDGACYQLASLNKQAWHAGKMNSRCLQELRCPATDYMATHKFTAAAEHQREFATQRLASHHDSIGIELVGAVIDGGDIYEPVTPQQIRALRWLISGLQTLLNIPLSEVFRHADMVRKNSAEASAAR